jgi:hypothetical protein
MGRFQFSLRMMLAAVAVVGIGAGLWVAEPSWQLGVVEALLLAWVPASAVLLSIQFTGKARAFWMGVAAECVWPILVCLSVAVLFSLGIVPVDSALPETPPLLTRPAWWFPGFLFDLSEHFLPVLLAWAFAPVVGLLCVLTHWLFIRPPVPKG